MRLRSLPSSPRFVHAVIFKRPRYACELCDTMVARYQRFLFITLGFLSAHFPLRVQEKWNNCRMNIQRQMNFLAWVDPALNA